MQIYRALVLALTLGSAVATLDQPDITYDALYQWGKESYTAGRWYECVAFMKRALEDYEYYGSVVAHCQKKCHKLVPLDPLVLTDRYLAQKSIPEIRFFEKIAQKSLCIRRCTEDRFSNRPAKSVTAKTEQVDAEFETLKPYSYMQFCYWKLNDLDHAVSTAYTYYIHNPKDEMMMDNLKFYSTQPQFSTKMYKDLEEPEFQEFYEKALQFYEDENFENAVVSFEQSLESYLKAYERCTLSCVSLYAENSISVDFYTAVTHHFESVLKCRNRCSSKLSFLKGQQMADFIPMHFHYLQYAYWKTSRTNKACESIGTYLLYLPKDKVMLENKEFYLKQKKLSEDMFQPRPEILRLYKQQSLDLKMVVYLDEKFKYNEDGELGVDHPDDYNEVQIGEDETWDQLLTQFENLENDRVDSASNGDDAIERRRKGYKGDTGDAKLEAKKNEKKQNGENKTKKKFIIPYVPPESALDEYRAKFGITVTKRESELNGTLRFFSDNLLSKPECNTLMSLKDFSKPGSGYAGKSSPHTSFEHFNGLTIDRLTQLVTDSRVPLETAKLFFDKSELARDFVEKYFNLSSHLYIDYTHFVCRSTKSERTDLSHPIHGDNCMLKDGRCDKRYPAFTWRDFSAIVYLNDDFDGGEFIFADSNENIEATLKPKCGQMVAFSGDTLHGVKAVTGGSRCVMALWMTLDPEHREVDRVRAQQVLAELELAKS